MAPEPHAAGPESTVRARSEMTPARRPAAPRRHRLPHRRLTETRRVVHTTPDGRSTPVSVSIGYVPASPARPREVFYDAGYRSGADLEFAVQDLCVVLSALLQHGVDPREIGRSLSVSYGPDEAPHHGSLAGTIAAELTVPPGWAEAADGEGDDAPMEREGSP